MGSAYLYAGGSENAVINTAYVERFQATLRSRLAPLVRKTRAAARLRRLRSGGRGDVVDRDGLQLLPGAPLSEVGTEWRCRAPAMGRTNSGSSCWAH